MNETIDTILGWIFAEIGDVALWSTPTFRALHAGPMRGHLRHWISEHRAAAAFYAARRTTPAYRDFLTQQGVGDIRRFTDIPPMDKDSYIKKFPIEALCRGGALPMRGAVIDESSGSSGPPANWIRSRHERQSIARLLQFSAQSVFGDEPFIMLNAFALGPWATGMSVSMALADRCLLKSVGPDVGKILRTLELFGPKYRYLIAGYPPFMKTLVDTPDFDWTPYNIVAIVGGEGMSEPLRAALNVYFKQTYSSFGASDLAINLGMETDFSIALRQAMLRDPALQQALVGTLDSLPMVFQYDPLSAHIESNPEGELLVTLNRLENASPRIRYNIHDYGLVRPLDHVLSVLRERQIVLDPAVPYAPLPFMFHFGRKEHAVAFYGCKITPGDLQAVLLQVPQLQAAVTDFALHPWEDESANKRLDFWFLLAPNQNAPVDLQAEVIAALARVNQDFRESIKMVPDAIQPQLTFYPAGTGPLANQDIRLKRKYIL